MLKGPQESRPSNNLLILYKMSIETKTYHDESPPPWQVLVLLASHFDPKTLAKASCVSKSWSISMSADHLWEPLCTTDFPSLSPLHAAAGVPYRRLYVLGQTSAKLRTRRPSKPFLSLEKLIFTVMVHHNGARVFSVVKSGADIENNPNGVFRFDNIEVENAEFWVGDEEAEEGLKATWNVVLEGYNGVFTMVDCRGKGRFVLGSDGWFSEELPAAGCCSGLAACGLVAEVRLGMKERESSGGERMRRRRKLVVEKVGVGVLNILSWRYVSIEDALRYLQHFLMPC